MPITTPTSTLTPAPAPALNLNQALNSGGLTLSPQPANGATPPPAPKTPNPAPVPTLSFLDGSSYNAKTGKQVNPPSVMTAKDAINNLTNQKAGLDQAVQAQAQQTQNIAAQQALAQATPAPAPAPAPAATADDLDKIINGEAGQQGAQKANDAIAAVQGQADAAFQNFQSQIQQILTGTFPLTPAQQAQIQATQNSFAQLKAQQDLANKNFEGMAKLSELPGVAPIINLGIIKNVVDEGVTKIANIDNQASKAVADLQQGFMNQDYTMINDAYSQASKLFADKTSAIQQMNDNVRNATNDALAIHKQQMDEAQQQLQNQQAAIQFAATNGITAPFYLVGNTAIDTKTGLPVTLAQYQQATGQQVGLPESQTDFSQIQHIADPAVVKLKNDYPDAGILLTDTPDQAEAKLANSALYRKAVYIAPSPYSRGTAGVSTVLDNKGNPVQVPSSVAPYYNTTSSGVGYVDATALQGTAAQKKQIIDDATASGLQVITNKNEAADLTNIKDANAKLDTIANIVGSVAQPSALARDLGGYGITKFEQIGQIDPTIASSGILTSAGLDIFKAISGLQGFRGNQTIIKEINNNLPSPTDTADVVNTKLNILRQLINDRENALVGGSSSTSNQNTPTIPKGTDGASYGYPGYVSDGTQWVKQ